MSRRMPRLELLSIFMNEMKSSVAGKAAPNPTIIKRAEMIAKARRNGGRAQKMYLESDFSKDWPEGLLERINAAN